MAGTLALPDLLRHAGAVMTQRDGWPVAAHYGSAAGELAVCVSGVGLAVRADLATFTIEAKPEAADRLLDRVLGHGLVPGGASLEAGAWWCRSAGAEELTVICPRSMAARLVRTLSHEITRIAHADMVDRWEDRVVLGVIGRKTIGVLEALEVFGAAGDPRRASPCTTTALAGHAVTWLLQADTAALAVVELDGAAAAWQALDDAGRPHGISCVGIEAIDRYCLTTRASRTGITLL